MIEVEVALHFHKTRSEGKAYLLVCFDWFDRLRGDEDLGYYYPRFDTPEAVRSHLAICQLGDWNARDARDVCEAVIDLRAAGENFSKAICQSPADWLRHNAP